jgi:PTS system beta-glucosides-specific IIC component
MSFLKKIFNSKEQPEVSIAAPVSGKLVPVQDVPDETFSGEMLGKGAAIQPSEGKIFSPVDGTVTSAFSTGHALSITSVDGAEILVHVGIDTVELKGKYFTKHVNEDDKVRKGDLLIEVDLEGARSEGYDMVVPVIVMNMDSFSSITVETGREIRAGEEMLKLTKA